MSACSLFDSEGGTPHIAPLPHIATLTSDRSYTDPNRTGGVSIPKLKLESTPEYKLHSINEQGKGDPYDLSKFSDRSSLMSGGSASARSSDSDYTVTTMTTMETKSRVSRRSQRTVKSVKSTSYAQDRQGMSVDEYMLNNDAFSVVESLNAEQHASRKLI